jgi:ubiquinone/menaquinone biosynthesis C-methylase UbiE
MDEINLQSVLSLAHGFMESRILLTAAELDLFTLLTPAPLSDKEIAERKKVSTRGLTTLLDALAAMGFLAKDSGKYHCPPAVSRLLSRESPGSILPMVMHMSHLWQRWSQLTEVVESGSAQEQPAPPFRDEDTLRAFIGAMHVIAKSFAPRVVASVKAGSSRALLDVGGAMGTYTLAFLEAVPEMKATLFDRPPVVEMARPFLGDAGVLDRVTLVAGDFYRDELPGGHDLAFLSAVIHQNSLKQNVALFSKVFRALMPGGRIVIRDHIMTPDRTKPKDGAVFAVNMLLATPGGGTYTYGEVREALAQAGFTRINLLRTGEHMDGLVEAFKS